MMRPQEMYLKTFMMSLVFFEPTLFYLYELFSSYQTKLVQSSCAFSSNTLPVKNKFFLPLSSVCVLRSYFTAEIQFHYLSFDLTSISVKLNKMFELVLNSIIFRTKIDKTNAILMQHFRSSAILSVKIAVLHCWEYRSEAAVTNM